MSYLSPGTEPRKFDKLEAVGGTFGAATQTGPSYPSNVQSPLNQVAVFQTMSKLMPVTGTTQGLAGPLTGLDVDDEAQVGSLSQTFAALNSTASSVKNITQSVTSLESARLSREGSQKFFQGLIEKSFTPGSKPSATRTSEEILSSISNGSVSDLATMMSTASGGVTTSKQLIEGINEGLIGYTSESSNAEADRLGPQGLSRERLLK